jgi:hypothetical protein
MTEEDLQLKRLPNRELLNNAVSEGKEVKPKEEVQSYDKT